MRIFPGERSSWLSSGTFKAAVFLILVAMTIAFWLYTQKIFNHIREFQKAVVKTQVQIHLSIIDSESTDDTGISSELFRAAVIDAPYPSIFTDETYEPLPGLWQNVGIAPNDTTQVSRRHLKSLIAKMDRVNPPERISMPGLETRTDTLTVYELPPGGRLPVIVTDPAGEILYYRNIGSAAADSVKMADLIRRVDLRVPPMVFSSKSMPMLQFHSINAGAAWPIIITDTGGIPVYWRGISMPAPGDSIIVRYALQPLIDDISRSGPVYDIVTTQSYQVENIWLFHYGDLDFLTLIGWLPIIEFAVILSLLSIGFIGLMNIKNAEQRYIWVGMAKETAHQLGTPISSLEGWLELLKAEPDLAMLGQAIPEIETDVVRLTRVAARFSSIGSRPELKPVELSDVIDDVTSYFRLRLPRMGKVVEINTYYNDLRMVMGNAEILNWAFENLIKNSLNALEDKKGSITVTASLSKNMRSVILDFSDTGKGIAPGDQPKVMRPGFTTKKRGWGLGLSLVKRIIEDYHGGKVTLLESRPGEITTFRVILPAIMT